MPERTRQRARRSIARLTVTDPGCSTCRGQRSSVPPARSTRAGALASIHWDIAAGLYGSRAIEGASELAARVVSRPKGGRRFAPRERERREGSALRSSPHPGEPQGGAPDGRRSRESESDVNSRLATPAETRIPETRTPSTVTVWPTEAFANSRSVVIMRQRSPLSAQKPSSCTGSSSGQASEWLRFALEADERAGHLPGDRDDARARGRDGDRSGERQGGVAGALLIGHQRQDQKQDRGRDAQGGIARSQPGRDAGIEALAQADRSPGVVEAGPEELADPTGRPAAGRAGPADREVVLEGLGLVPRDFAVEVSVEEETGAGAVHRTEGKNGPPGLLIPP